MCVGCMGTYLVSVPYVIGPLGLISCVNQIRSSWVLLRVNSILNWAKCEVLMK